MWRGGLHHWGAHSRSEEAGLGMCGGPWVGAAPPSPRDVSASVCSATGAAMPAKLHSASLSAWPVPGTGCWGAGMVVAVQRGMNYLQNLQAVEARESFPWDTGDLVSREASAVKRRASNASASL